MQINEISNEIPIEVPIVTFEEPTAFAQPTASAGTSSSTGTEQSLLSALEASSPGISPTASFLSHLQEIQTESQADFAFVTAHVAEQLQDDAKVAAREGNARQAAELTSVATVFDSSTHTGQVPTVNALEQAGVSTAHYHGHATDPVSAPAAATGSIEDIVASEVSTAIGDLNSPLG